jgi:hypothetical protein
MLKKLFYRLILLSVIGMLVAPFILKRENGAAIMSMDEFLSFDIDLIKNKYQTTAAQISLMFGQDDIEPILAPGESPAPKFTKLYKWQDEKGEWHFSDAPTDSYEQEEIEININRNVLNFRDLPQKYSESEETSEITNTEQKNNKKVNQEKTTGYFNSMTSTLNDSKNVQSQVDENFERKSDAIDNN